MSVINAVLDVEALAVSKQSLPASRIKKLRCGGKPRLVLEVVLHGTLQESDGRESNPHTVSHSHVP
jgi:hypothetical protein